MESDQGRDLARVLEECLKCGRRDEWEVFIRQSQPVVASAVLRTLARFGVRDRQSADDLIQDVFLRLCADNFHAVRSFRSGDANALRAWLRVVAASIVIDHLKARSSQKQGGGAVPLSLDDPEAGAVAADDSALCEIERKLLMNRIEGCLKGEKDRDQRIFWLYHRHGYTPRAIAAWPGIGLGQGGVEMVLYRLTRAIRECVNGAINFRTRGEGVRS